jgi:hypothetical protein
LHYLLTIAVPEFRRETRGLISGLPLDVNISLWIGSQRSMDVTYHTERENDESKVTVSLRYGRRHTDKPYNIWFRSKEPFSPDADFLLPLTLLPAMHRAEELVFDEHDSIDEAMKANIEQIETLYMRFGPPNGHHFKRIDVRVRGEKKPPRPDGRGVACFFSCGVDSFYSVLKHREELDALIFIRGFDTRLDKLEVAELQIAEVRKAAEELGIRLIEVTTTAREFSEGSLWLHWDLYHGGVMAAIAHLLSPEFRRIYISSSYPYEHLYGGGTHPLLDPLWSGSGVELVHAGAEADRWEKLTDISQYEVVQNHLKICWKNYKGMGNCGRCFQCLRAMGILEVLGRRHLFHTFPEDFEPELLEKVGVGLLESMQVSFDYWKLVKDHPRLAAAARANINGSIAKVQALIGDGFEKGPAGDPSLS